MRGFESFTTSTSYEDRFGDFDDRDEVEAASLWETDDRGVRPSDDSGIDYAQDAEGVHDLTDTHLSNDDEIDVMEVQAAKDVYDTDLGGSYSEAA